MALRVGLVGTGHWARTVHGVGVASHPEAELVGVWGRDPAKAAAVADELGTTAYDDFDALVSSVDALTFAVPPDVQAPLATRAAEAGRHLLLEKPIAIDLAAADRLVAAAREVSTLVFFTGRFVPGWEQWLDGVRSRPLLGGRAEWLTATDPDGPYSSSPWRKVEGALWDVGPHALSFLLPALGPVETVSGSRGRGDLVHLVLGHRGGATSVMSLSMTMPPSAQRVMVEVYDDRGFHQRPDDEREVAAAYTAALGELVGCVQEGLTEHRCDVRLGREVVDVLARCASAVDDVSTR